MWARPSREEGPSCRRESAAAEEAASLFVIVLMASSIGAPSRPCMIRAGKPASPRVLPTKRGARQKRRPPGEGGFRPFLSTICEKKSTFHALATVGWQAGQIRARTIIAVENRECCLRDSQPRRIDRIGSFSGRALLPRRWAAQKGRFRFSFTIPVFPEISRGVLRGQGGGFWLHGPARRQDVSGGCNVLG